MVRILALLLSCFGAVSFFSLVSFWGFLSATRYSTDHIDQLNRLWAHGEVLRRIVEKPAIDAVDLGYVRQAAASARAILDSLEKGGDGEAGLFIQPLPAPLETGVRQLRESWSSMEAAGLIQLAQSNQAEGFDEEESRRLSTLLPVFQKRAEELVASVRARSRKLRTMVLAVLGASTALSLVLFGVSLTIVYRRIIGPIHELQQGTAAIQESHFEHRVPVHYGDELGTLAHSFNQMAAMLARLFADEKRLSAELQAANERLRESEERLRHAQAVARLGNWDLDWKNQEYYWSEQVYRIFGRDPATEPVNEERFFSWVHPDDQDRVRAAVAEAIARRDPYEVEHRIVLPDGAVRFVREQAELFYGDSDEPLRLTGTVQDITDRKAAEEQLRQSAKMEAVGRLAGGVAHDFNNLLTVINGYALLALRRVGEDSQLRHEVEQIQLAGERAAALTQQLLAFGRKQILQPRAINLNHVIERIAPLMARLLTESVELVLRLDAGLHTTLADPTQLEQVVMNLVVNARDSMALGGRLLIETQNVELDEDYAKAHVDAKPGPHVLLSVTDTGEGMEKSVIDRIFEPFFTTKELGKGTGLGLATLFGIVKQSGGHVWVYSEINRGSTFKVYLPALTESSPAADEPKAASALREGMETVLLVEDNDQVRDYVSGVLQRAGYQVLPASSGKDALALAESFPSPIHLAITDVVLPKMSGEELSARLRANRPGIRILYISGYTKDAIAHQGVLAADVEFLAKPFTPEAILDKVRQVLDAPAKRRSVLVVDDEPAIRELLGELLSADGFEVVQAANGKEAIAVCQERSFDIALVDLVMPEQEGLETIQQMRNEFPQLRIVAMTGAFQGLFLKAATLMGADAILQKPIKPAELSAALGHLFPA